MKQLMLLCSMLCCFSCMTAQTETGKLSVTPMAGINILMSEPLEPLCGVTAGAGVDWQVSNRIALSSGLFYSYQRYDLTATAYSPGIVTKPLNTVYYSNNLPKQVSNPIRDGRLVVPLTVSAYVWKGLALKAGIQANVRLHSGIADQHEESPTYGMIIENDIVSTGHAMHACFFSLPVGLSYEYRRFILDVRYIFGLQNLRTDREDVIQSKYTMFLVTNEERWWDNQEVNQLQITLGYRIGL